MKKRAQGFGVVEMIIILVIVGVVGVGGWYVWQANNRPSSPTATSTQETVVEIKEYKNDEYGFSFKYPANWNLNVELESAGRGREEGQIKITSPENVIVWLKPNLGGKGGDCQPAPTDIPHHTEKCPTIEYLTKEELTTTASGSEPLTLYHFKYTADRSTKSSYGVFVSSIPIDKPLPAAYIGAVMNFGMITHKGGYIENFITGFDESSIESLNTTKVKDAEQILRSLKLY